MTRPHLPIPVNLKKGKIRFKITSRCFNTFNWSYALLKIHEFDSIFPISTQVFLFFCSMSISVCLCFFLDLLYYLCPAPSATPRSRVSPVGPDDILRLLLLSYTRKGSGRYTPTCIHTCKHTPAPTLARSHTHIYSNTHHHSEEDRVKSV